MSKYTIKKLASFLAAVCLLVPLGSVQASPNPPADGVTNVITGPSLNARIVFRNLLSAGVATVIGKCNGELFSFELFGLFVNPDEVKISVLQDYVAEGEGPAGCYSMEGGEDVIIKKINKFVPANGTGPALADVEAQVIIPKDQHTQPNK